MTLPLGRLAALGLGMAALALPATAAADTITDTYSVPGTYTLTIPQYTTSVNVIANGAEVALPKMAVPGVFRGQLYNQPFPHIWADILFWVLPASEMGIAVLLLFSRTAFTGLVLSAVLLTAFTGYIALILAGAWHRVPCSCGGIISHLSWQGHLALNIAFLFLNLIAIKVERRKLRHPAVA